MQEDQDNERESGDVAAYAEVDQAWLMGAIESMLFVTDEPVGVLTFADMLASRSCPRAGIACVLAKGARASREGNSASRSCWRLASVHASPLPRAHRALCSFMGYSQAFPAALETLAVVAYCQPYPQRCCLGRGVSSG